MINKCVIQGRLTKNVELRYTQSNTPVASFTVAWSEKYKDTEQKLFMPCVAWRNTAQFAANYFDKGQECVVEGKLTTRKWTDRDGNNRETVELVVDQMHFCGSKREGGSQGNTYANGSQAAGRPVDVDASNFGDYEDVDSGVLPF